MLAFYFLVSVCQTWESLDVAARRPVNVPQLKIMICLNVCQAFDSHLYQVTFIYDTLLAKKTFSSLFAK